ncbi:MAG: hypothetical protein PGN13_04930 [Patulibacter minatonensis]
MSAPGTVTTIGDTDARREAARRLIFRIDDVQRAARSLEDRGPFLRTRLVAAAAVVVIAGFAVAGELPAPVGIAAFALLAAAGEVVRRRLKPGRRYESASVVRTERRAERSYLEAFWFAGIPLWLGNAAAGIWVGLALAAVGGLLGAWWVKRRRAAERPYGDDLVVEPAPATMLVMAALSVLERAKLPALEEALGRNELTLLTELADLEQRRWAVVAGDWWQLTDRGRGVFSAEVAAIERVAAFEGR